MFFSSFYAATILLKTLQSSSNPEIITNQIDPFEYEIPDATQFNIFKSGITINQLSLFYANNPYVIFDAWIDRYPILNINFINNHSKHNGVSTSNERSLRQNPNNTKKNYYKQIEPSQIGNTTGQKEKKFEKPAKPYSMLYNFCNVKDEYFVDSISISFRTHNNSTPPPSPTINHNQDSNLLFNTSKNLRIIIQREKGKIINELNKLYDEKTKRYKYHSRRLICCLDLFEILCRISLYRCTIYDNEIGVTDAVKVCIRAFLNLYLDKFDSFEIDKLTAVNTADMCTITLILKK
ncbi:hypothetical protein BDAP_000849 [Binucleata daphniae]